MDKVVIFGIGVNASVAYWHLTNDSPYEIGGFTVDQEYLKKDSLFELPVIAFEDVESYFPSNAYKMFIPLSFKRVNTLRAEKYFEAKAKGYDLISYISTKATTWPGLIVGDNCYVCENSVIMPFAEIGNNVTIGSGSIIGHHAVIKDHCFVAAHAVVLGEATVEPYCFIGANATIRDRITVAGECVIDSGAVINKNTVEKGVYISSRPQLLPRLSDKLRTWLTFPVK